ncbi:MAG: amidohydrolase [Bacillota bacterium]
MQAFINARLFTVSGPVIDQGTLLEKDGRIIAVGRNLPVPETASTVDLAGKTLMPGLVEAHCHLGIFDFWQAEAGAKTGSSSLGEAVTPALDYYYALNPHSPGLKRARQTGVTTLLTGPGSGKVVGGLSVVTRTYGTDREQIVLRRPAGVKMAFGENPKHFGKQGQMPATRMGVAALLRSALVAARNYLAKQVSDDPGKRPPHDAELEIMARVLKRELRARIHAHRADDIMSILRIVDEFNIDITLEHATEAYKVAGEIARRRIPCVTGPSYGSRDKVELRDETFANPGILERAGIQVAITTDASIVAIDYLRHEAILAHREGMSAAGALGAITLTAAEIIGVADRVGSLDVGKDADLLVLNGDPLEFTSRVERVYGAGRLIYHRETHREEWDQ